MPATFHESYDAVVIGARVAGAATAMLLARGGLRVLVIDRARRGADTVSTHALMRGGVVQLHRWGLLPRLAATGTPAVRTTTFHYGPESIPVAIKPRDGVDALYAPRRTVLDALLSRAAEESGADLRHQWKLVGLDRDTRGRVAGVAIEDRDGRIARVAAGIVIGADGVGSTVARLAGAEILAQGRHASGTAYGYWPDLDLDGYHWHYVHSLGAGAIPTTGGKTCVFVSMTAERFRGDLRLDLASGFHRALGAVAPELAGRVSGRAPSEALRAFAGVRGYVRRAHGPGWALVGDAGFFRDPLTAHGMTDALRDAGLLARAYALRGEPGLADYERERDAWAHDMLEVSDAIASFEWDLASVREDHKRLSQLMARESEMLAGLVEEPSEAGAVAAGSSIYTGTTTGVSHRSTSVVVPPRSSRPS